MISIRNTKRAAGSLLAAALTLGLGACATQPGTTSASAPAAAHYADITEDSIKVFVNRVVQPYQIVRTVRAEVFVLDAKSEEEAELRAFKQLLHLAREAGADAVMEVKRSMTLDSVSQRITASPPAGSSGIFRDDMDPTAVMLDDMTLADYWRGKGTLSSARIDTTFGRRAIEQKSVVFTAKAIRLKR